MKNENIIAKIEEYVATLSDEDKKEYKDFFELSEKQNTPISGMKFYLGKMKPLAEIVQELKKDIKIAEMKNTKGNSEVKRFKLISKLLASNYRDEFTTAWKETINNEEMQCCIIDAYYAFAFRNFLDVPMQENSQFSINKIIPNIHLAEPCIYDLAEIKTALKLHKTKKSVEKCFVQIKDKWYTAKYFINVIEGLGGNVQMYQNTDIYGMDMFESENGIAILCPAKVPNKKG